LLFELSIARQLGALHALDRTLVAQREAA
jgi:hypothetical protein